MRCMATPNAGISFHEMVHHLSVNTYFFALLVISRMLITESLANYAGLADKESPIGCIYLDPESTAILSLMSIRNFRAISINEGDVHSTDHEWTRINFNGQQPSLEFWHHIRWRYLVPDHADIVGELRELSPSHAMLESTYTPGKARVNSGLLAYFWYILTSIHASRLCKCMTLM